MNTPPRENHHVDIYADASSDQLKFWDALARYPRFNMLWSVADRSVDEEAVQQELGVMSSGERYMLLFFVAVWKHQNTEDFAFDLIDACSVLDEQSREIIIDWVRSPYWP